MLKDRMRLQTLGCLALWLASTTAALSSQLPPNHPPVASGKGNRTESSRLTESLRPSENDEISTIPHKNFIDDFIFGKKMKEDDIPHAPLASDEEFLRRVHLDLTGRSPNDDELRAFLSDADPHKRDTLIDRLADSPAAQAKWTYFFSDIFKPARNRVGSGGKNLFRQWLYDNIHLDRPWNQTVREMLTASAASNYYVGPASYVARSVVIGANCDEEIHEDTADEIALTAVKHFLGVDLTCVSCHNGKYHLEKINLWLSQQERRETWEMGAFFGKTRVLRRTERRTDRDEYSIDDSGPGYNPSAESVVRVPRFGQDTLLAPRYMFTGEAPDPSLNGQSLRQEFARMLTQDRQFARSTVNLLWSEMFGVGIVDPPLDFDLARLDPDNPPPGDWPLQPSHPRLLEALADDFIDTSYSIRSMIKRIARSSAYQLSSKFPVQWEARYAPYFARRFVRRLSSEQIYDSLVNSTNLFTEFQIPGTDLAGRYAIDVFSPEDLKLRGGKGHPEIHFFLEAFGQPNREFSERSNEGEITQAILLMNSQFVLNQIKASPDSFLHGLLQDGDSSTDEKITRLFRRFLVRNPTSDEMAQAKDAVSRGTPGWEDLQWLLINKVEFVHNY